jgi:hypothetical protein
MGLELNKLLLEKGLRICEKRVLLRRGFLSGRYYSFMDLQAKRLWVQIDAKIERMGGCDKIPPLEF